MAHSSVFATFFAGYGANKIILVIVSAEVMA
jgi:hypothetical protein